MQKFAAREAFQFPNGATGYRPGGPFDCLGPFAKVLQCPIFVHGADTGLRRACYATGYADTFFSVPACTRIRGRYVAGYFTQDDGAISFRVMERHADRVQGVAS